MCRVTRIEWTYRTAGAGANRADSAVRVEVFRDGDLLADANDRLGGNARLNRTETAARAWTAEAPTTAGSSPPGIVAPPFEYFPDGVHGHLDVRFRVDGYDAWQIRRIESTVITSELRPVLGLIGVYEWAERREQFEFDGVGVLQADPHDGTAILELSY